MATQAKSIVLGPGEGKKVSAMANEVTYKAVSEETDGAYALIEYKAAPKFAGNPRASSGTGRQRYTSWKGSLLSKWAIRLSKRPPVLLSKFPEAVSSPSRTRDRSLPGFWRSIPPAGSRSTLRRCLKSLRNTVTRHRRML